MGVPKKFIFVLSGPIVVSAFSNLALFSGSQSSLKLPFRSSTVAVCSNELAVDIILLRSGSPGQANMALPTKPTPCSVEDWFKANGFKISKSSHLGGSGWATQTRFKSECGQEFFVKTARQSAEKMFAGEALGLQAIYESTDALRIPKVFTCNDDGVGGSYIIMEHLSLGGSGNQTALGRAVARMHLAEPAAEEAKQGKFGFAVDNTIGGTHQPNRWDDDWVRFFREQRIGHQLKLAENAECDRIWTKVLEKTDGLKQLFVGIEVRPSILHGDLWSGNIATAEGRPCIFDPACYYGHHEAEWGMSW
mmetsp:Transcript_2930/g.8058  ORF Transcript_2930/g.8058 Transcript_2930/m.8058 type:complete len:306 (-) Transcript_2930:774-1691(-)